MNNRRKIKVYVAGPIQGETLLHSLANIEHGLEMTAKIFQLGFSPFPVFSDAAFIQKVRPIPDISDVYQYSLEWLRQSNIVFGLSGWDKSTGCKAEMKLAMELGIPIVFELHDLSAWADRVQHPASDVEQIMARSDD